MNPALEQLLQRPDVWRPRDRRRLTPSARCHSTGFDALDRALHGGWPRSALTELLLPQPGSGELFLLSPLLAQLSHKRLLTVWINPPFIPYAPALVQRGVALESLLIVRGSPQHHLWACEQALRSGGCGAVLYWPAQSLRYAELRKLQVAAAAQHAMGFLFRDTRAAQQTSPAALRLQLETRNTHTLNTQLAIHILKQRGHSAGQTLLLSCKEPLARQELLAREEFLSPQKTLPAEKSLTPIRSTQPALTIMAGDTNAIAHASAHARSSATAAH